ncbi:MAG: hypothetical protein DA405_12200 [Bacteroidetes bacterium]|nr:MAG: hypothetical protein DA405_12200 [Bacteroidota bacterium]
MIKAKPLFRYLAVCLVMGAQTINAQVKIGDNPSTINGSALLELEATNKGVLIPRLTTAQRDAISNPALGLIIFNTSTNCLNHYIGPKWFEMCGVETSLPAALGSTFTGHSNSINENFSANAACQNKLISAGYSAASCNGNVVVGANIYPVVSINGQCWMQTNLKQASTSPCSDGINAGCNAWLITSPGDIGSWGYYNSATSSGAAGWATTESAAGEGLLYQWSAAMNNSTAERTQGVCPSGWHIPSDCEWMYLEHGQGMSIAQQTINIAWRNTTGEGDKLRAEGGSWNNSSGFTALLAGYRFTDGTFYVNGTGGYWWSSSESATTIAHFRSFFSTQAGVYRGDGDKAHGFSVRCLKD